uniref:NADH-ubiquinone oxidoreductase chain 2 n=1 Tax=Leiosaurus catamarcensis TaxID=161146 RepID=Q71DY5_9SAUR|nr:NADH dehydrogenase subunit 2 [Leiosaurus catamarcensis]
MSPTTTTIITSSLATGTIITASSHHWLLAWVGLELNTLAIIPMISKHHHPRATEAATKYFLTQAAASALILFSSMLNAWQTGSWDIMQPASTTSSLLLTAALAMKLGLVPMHFWLPEVLQGSSMKTALIMSTWQKLAPLALVYLTSNTLSTTTLLLMATMSALVGGWGGLNQTQLRKIMAYSSIAHIGWMVAIAQIMSSTLILYLTLYLFMTTSIFSALILSQSKSIKDTATAMTTSPMLTLTTMLTLLSLGGLPPLTGFLPKLLVLKGLTTQGLLLISTALAMSSLLSLFFYLRLSYMASLTLAPNTLLTKHKWRFKPAPKTLLMTLSSPLALMLLPMAPLMM